MKKFLALLVAFGMIGFVAGCNGSDKKDDDKKEPEKKEPEKKEG